MRTIAGRVTLKRFEIACINIAQSISKKCGSVIESEVGMARISPK